MRHLGHQAHRQHGPQDVRGVGQGHQPGALVEQALVHVEADLALVGDRDDAQPGAALATEHVPGDDVRVVLEGGQDDLVAGPDPAPPPGLGHQVDGFRCAAHKDDLAGRAGAEEELHLAAGPLEGVGGAGRQGVGAPMDVGVVSRVEVRHRLDHRERLVRRGGVVQPDERLAVDALVQCREFAAHRVHVEQVAGGRFTRLRIAPPGGRVPGPTRGALMECLGRRRPRGGGGSVAHSRRRRPGGSSHGRRAPGWRGRLLLRSLRGGRERRGLLRQEPLEEVIPRHLAWGSGRDGRRARDRRARQRRRRPRAARGAAIGGWGGAC